MTASPTTPGSRLEAGSFRDPESRVFYTGGERLPRALGPGSRRLGEAEVERALRRARRATAVSSPPSRWPRRTSPPRCRASWAGVLRHETIPTISYPYEWSFSQLKDAALLQLDLLLASLKRDMILKDSTPYNVQFRGAQPTFIDIGSFEALRPGEPWVGYRQFCMLYLYPADAAGLQGRELPALAARLARGHHAPRTWPRSCRARRPARASPSTCRSTRAWRRRYAGKSEQVKTDLKKAGFKKELIVANVRKLHKTIRSSLDARRRGGLGRVRDEELLPGHRDRREEGLRPQAAAATQRWPRVWDLGANDHRFSLIAAEHADHVVSRRRRRGHRRRRLPQAPRRGPHRHHLARDVADRHVAGPRVGPHASAGRSRPAASRTSS